MSSRLSWSTLQAPGLCRKTLSQDDDDGAGEVAQQLRAFVLLEDVGLSPTPTGYLCSSRVPVSSSDF